MHVRHPVSLMVISSASVFLLIEILGSWSWPSWFAWGLASLLLAALLNLVIWLYLRA